MANTAPYGDVSSVLLEHVLDNKNLTPIPGLPPVSVPGMTADALMLVTGLAVAAGLSLWAARTHSVKPRGWALALEVLVLFVKDDLVYPVLGKERGRRWLAVFTALFLFILVLNVLGMVPSLKTATGSLSVTSALAAMVLTLILATGLIRLGPGGFVGNMVPSDVPLVIAVFVAALDFVGLFIKGAVLSLRLLANMFAGHLAVLCFLVMMFTVSPSMAVVSLPFALFTSVLDVLIALIQALVFTLLGCVFLQMASTRHGKP
jgi:F-type H+-transporting ATPase subunit a